MTRLTGIVKFWKADKAYGFITPDDGGADLFFHLRDLNVRASDAPDHGVRVTFEPGDGPKGPKAMNVEVVR